MSTQVNALLSIDRSLQKLSFITEILSAEVVEPTEPHTKKGLQTIIEAIQDDLEFASENLNAAQW